MNSKSLSINYYEQNAEAYITNTVNADLSATQKRFLSYLKPDSLILDFGCGSGRDTKEFLDEGYKVEAMDGSEKFCKYATEYTGIQVKHMCFQNLNEVDKYDGVWACASILHLPMEDLKLVLKKIECALKINGIFYTSFKYGEFEGIRNERYFTDMTSEKFDHLLDEMEIFQIQEQWITTDVRKDRENEKWLNVILKKAKNH